MFRQIFRYEFGWQASRDGWPVWSGVKQVLFTPRISYSCYYILLLLLIVTKKIIRANTLLKD